MMNLRIFDPKKLEPHNVQSCSYLSDTVAALWSNKELKHTELSLVHLTINI
jgi:hypothetical protein